MGNTSYSIDLLMRTARDASFESGATPMSVCARLFQIRPTPHAKHGHSYPPALHDTLTALTDPRGGGYHYSQAAEAVVDFKGGYWPVHQVLLALNGIYTERSANDEAGRMEMLVEAGCGSDGIGLSLGDFVALAAEASLFPEQEERLLGPLVQAGGFGLAECAVALYPYLRGGANKAIARLTYALARYPEGEPTPLRGCCAALAAVKLTPTPPVAVYMNALYSAYFYDDHILRCACYEAGLGITPLAEHFISPRSAAWRF